MTVTGVKKALEKIDEIECFVLTATPKIYVGRMLKESFILNEEDATLECHEADGMVSYLIDVNDINTIVFNNGNKLNPNFPL